MIKAKCISIRYRDIKPFCDDRYFDPNSTDIIDDQIARYKKGKLNFYQFYDNINKILGNIPRYDEKTVHTIRRFYESIKEEDKKNLYMKLSQETYVFELLLEHGILNPSKEELLQFISNNLEFDDKIISILFPTYIHPNDIFDLSTYHLHSFIDLINSNSLLYLTKNGLDIKNKRISNWVNSQEYVYIRDDVNKFLLISQHNPECLFNRNERKLFLSHLFLSRTLLARMFTSLEHVLSEYIHEGVISNISFHYIKLCISL